MLYSFFEKMLDSGEQNSIENTEWGQRIRTKHLYITLFELVGLKVIYYKVSLSNTEETYSFGEMVLVKRESSGLRK